MLKDASTIWKKHFWYLLGKVDKEHMDSVTSQVLAMTAGEAGGQLPRLLE